LSWIPVKRIKFLDKTEGFYILTSFDLKRSYYAPFFQGLSVMIVDLQSISRSPRHFNFTVSPDWWRKNDGDAQIEGLAGPLIAKISVSREEKNYGVNGHLAGKLRLVCGRCLEAYTFAVIRDFHLILSLPVSLESIRDETELEKEDLTVRFIADEKIDLDDIILEQIYLSLPMRLLCKKKCKGLCPRCGINLNIDTCNCDKGGGHPAFLKLKDLKIE
jgi:uncharacterized protein